jgi:hypothetical protein
MGTNRELAAAASLAARAAASNRSMKISAIIAVPSMVRSTRLDGRAELWVQVVPGQHNLASLLLVDLPTARNLLLRAKHLFGAAIDGLGFTGARRESGKSEHDGGAGRVRSRCSSQGASKPQRPTRETRRQKAMS